MKYGIGQPVSRFEDRRLLTGGGNYLDDTDLPGQARAYILRSPHAHARLLGIDAAAAKAAPGVVAVYTAADLAEDPLGTTAPSLKRTRPDGSPMFFVPQQALAHDAVRFVGEPVALVIAETVNQAKDAAELIEVAYEALPSVTDTGSAVGGPPVWADCPDNISHVFEIGDRAATDAAFAGAAHVAEIRHVISRVHAHYMEPRGAIGEYHPGEQRYTLHSDTQTPHRTRHVMATSFLDVPEHRVRVVCGDIGGAFGIKNGNYPEQRLLLWAARRLGRPVKWICERSEAALADDHARDLVTEAALALDAEGNFLALRVRNTSNLGAYLSHDGNIGPTFINLASVVGVYRTPVAHAHVTAVFTNTNATSAYRGAGRPEAIFIMERLVEAAARVTGIASVELRRRNMIRPDAMPYRTALGLNYDCGDFPGNLETLLRLGDYDGFPARRAAARLRGRLRGIGIANTIERAAPPGQEFAEIRFDQSGGATLLMGTKTQGMSHETTFKQILFEKLGLLPDEVRFVDGDTDKVAFGNGTMGSRSTAIGGTAVTVASDKVIAKGRLIAAHLLEASEADLGFAEGRFTVEGTDRSVTLQEVVRAAFVPAKLPRGMEPGLDATGSFAPVQDTFPNGAHLVELEIDPETGTLEFCSYLVVDDVGTVINPKTFGGQIHGGVVQGVGQVLMEQIVYDPDSGQLLTGSFMDYAMPRADSLCPIEVSSNPVPTRLNPLGAKGAGEAGTVGALPAVMNAILDALAPVGVTHIDMPATPYRIWQAIRAAA